MKKKSSLQLVHTSHAKPISVCRKPVGRKPSTKVNKNTKTKKKSLLELVQARVSKPTSPKVQREKKRWAKGVLQSPENGKVEDDTDQMARTDFPRNAGSGAIEDNKDTNEMLSGECQREFNAEIFEAAAELAEFLRRPRSRSSSVSERGV